MVITTAKGLLKEKKCYSIIANYRFIGFQLTGSLHKVISFKTTSSMVFLHTFSSFGNIRWQSYTHNLWLYKLGGLQMSTVVMGARFFDFSHLWKTSYGKVLTLLGTRWRLAMGRACSYRKTVTKFCVTHASTEKWTLKWSYWGLNRQSQSSIQKRE